ncbi:MAG: prepilin-type N-terminal cleavage/methylation domain-containing protein [Patescibacteria group bacterium]|nr:prepilin-type N-terminal cleavage/methylation domain-containing protein [Patescibacteria group bacterium]
MRKGFTMAEMLIVVAIMIVIGVVAYLNLYGSQKEATLNSSAIQVGALLRQAQSRSVSGDQGLAWGVHFDNTNPAAPSVTLFAVSGTVGFSSSSLLAGTYQLPFGICFTKPDFGSAADVIFSPISGQVSGQSDLVTLKTCNGNGSIASWNQQQSLPQPDSGSTVVYGNYIYIVGGYGNGPYNSVYYAHINADGTLGNWTPAASLPATVYVQGAAAYGGYLYSMGGYNSNTWHAYTSTVNFAEINNDGSLGSWTATLPLPTTVTNNAGVAANGYVYSIGGVGAYSIPLNQIFYAKIKTDGTLGNWNTTSSPLTGYGSAVIAGSYLYIVGGYGGLGATSSVWFARMNADGSIGAWTQTASLPSSAFDQALAANQGYLYSMGGFNNWSITQEVDYAKINNDGTLGDWVVGKPLPRQNYIASGASYNGYILFVGGRDQNFNYQSTVYSAALVNFLSPSTLTITPQGSISN